MVAQMISKPPPPSPAVKKGDLLTEEELDEAVHSVQLWALAKGMIPIAAIISRRVEGKHEVLGFGHNHLAEGIPGIHGETGALINMGRLPIGPAGYQDLVATSSLNPCPFCQRTLACHLGIREVRILDAENYSPDLSSYPASLTPTIKHHPATARTFKTWVNDPKFALLWERDIGIYNHHHAAPLDLLKHRDRLQAALKLATLKAHQGLEAGEAPIGAVILDSHGQVIGAGHPDILHGNDPTAVAAMAAWRACGARDHWKDKTLVLTTGPDHIAYSMFHIFNFGQLAVGSADVFAGQYAALKSKFTRVTLLGDEGADALLKDWIAKTPPARVDEYLGVLP